MLASTVPASADTTAEVVTFTGSIKADVSGSIALSPPLTNSASKGPVTFKTVATLSKVTGSKTQEGVTITGGKYVSTTTLPKGTRPARASSRGPSRWAPGP